MQRRPLSETATIIRSVLPTKQKRSKKGYRTRRPKFRKQVIGSASPPVSCGPLTIVSALTELYYVRVTYQVHCDDGVTRVVTNRSIPEYIPGVALGPRRLQSLSRLCANSTFVWQIRLQYGNAQLLFVLRSSRMKRTRRERFGIDKAHAAG